MIPGVRNLQQPMQLAQDRITLAGLPAHLSAFLGVLDGVADRFDGYGVDHG